MKLRITLLAATLLLSAYFANGDDKLKDINIPVSNVDSGLAKTKSKDESHASITSEGPVIVYENKTIL